MVSGVSIALLTPMAGAAIDLDALGALVERAIAAGVDGLSPVGSTGEGVRLTCDERAQVVSYVASRADGRPVVAGVPMGPLSATLEELHRVAAAGATAALVPPPSYYPISDAELLALFEGLADRSPLPLVLYHIPGLAGAGFSAAVVHRLAAHPTIVGLKDSSRDLDYLRSIVDAALDVVTGTDVLLPESLALGATGTIAASPNVAPSLAVDLMRACVAGDLEEVERLRALLTDLVTACRAAGFPTGWKHAAALVGIGDGRPVPPGLPLGPDRADPLRAALRRLGLVGQ